MLSAALFISTIVVFSSPASGFAAMAAESTAAA